MESFNNAVLLDPADVDDVKDILSKKRKRSIEKGYLDNLRYVSVYEQARQ